MEDALRERLAKSLPSFETYASTCVSAPSGLRWRRTKNAVSSLKLGHGGASSLVVASPSFRRICKRGGWLSNGRQNATFAAPGSSDARAMRQAFPNSSVCRARNGDDRRPRGFTGVVLVREEAAVRRVPLIAARRAHREQRGGFAEGVAAVARES